MGQKSGHSLAESLTQGLPGLHKDWAVFSLGGSHGEESISKLIQMVGRIHFLVAV